MDGRRERKEKLMKEKKIGKQSSSMEERKDLIPKY